jgi:hypothetical protein
MKSVAVQNKNDPGLEVIRSLASSFKSLDLVGEHSVESDGRPRGLLNATEETLPA